MSATSDSRQVTLGRAGNFAEAARDWGLANLHQNIAERMWDRHDALGTPKNDAGRRRQFEIGKAGDMAWEIGAEHAKRATMQNTPAIKTGTFTTRHYLYAGIGSRN